MVLKLDHVENEKIAVLTLNRPEVLNALNTELGLEMITALKEVAEDKKTRVIVITAEGDRAFCVGGDLKERNHMTDEQWLKQHLMFQELFQRIRQSKKPVITAVNGFALGGGCELAMSGSLIYASDRALFGLPEVTRGIIPGVGGTQTVGRFLPRVHAMKMLLTGEAIQVDEALQLGMVNDALPPDQVLRAALETARLISDNSPIAVRMAKKAFTRGVDMPLEEGIEFALECYNRTVSHPDRQEGVQAFNEKRKPQFQDIM
ncbi:enoyl-CoA hydratase/isomerase family protein [Alteribacillus sp. JSM 102045]|uniref:enoyl-CoA hydratase/isomerase family protein n=1 Tax=Alteribacillus sp. JSM 102045 TaxID=1562101 RepID=UPI0035C1B15A